MTTKKEIQKHLKCALSEIGKINPWFNEEFNIWIFSSPLYPVEYSGNTKNDVIKNYPAYLQDFIEERLNKNLSEFTEVRTLGLAGKRIES